MDPVLARATGMEHNQLSSVLPLHAEARCLRGTGPLSLGLHRRARRLLGSLRVAARPDPQRRVGDLRDPPARAGRVLHGREERNPAEGGLERDTDFAGSASALVLLKSRTLSPAIDAEIEGDEDEPLSPEELAEAHGMLEDSSRRRTSARTFRRERGPLPFGPHPAPEARPPAGQTERVSLAARRAFSRLIEPPVRHLGPIP